MIPNRSDKEPPNDARRIVIDTNILIGSLYAPQSASGKIVRACLRGNLLVLLSEGVFGEYRYILPRAVQGKDYQGLLDQLEGLALWVEPKEVPPVVTEDPQDDKLIALAVAGGANALITNDRGVLNLHPYRGIEILRPVKFLENRENRN